MATNSKGKRVKQFRTLIPQLDQSATHEVMHVYFKADEGLFYLYVPEHIAKVVNSIEPNYNSTGAVYANQHGSVRAPMLENCINAFEQVLSEFRTIMKEENKKKVIRITFKYNIDRMPDGSFRGYNPGNDIGFTGRPALHIMHEVLWQSGNRLFEQNRPQDALRDVGPATNRFSRLPHNEGRYLIDWTQEREDFFAHMKSSLEKLIHLMITFTQELEQDPDRAIAVMQFGATLLPPIAENKEAL